MSKDFWSRRRAGVEAELQEAEKAEENAILADQHAELETQTDAEILETLDLPDPDTLKEGDDFTAFLVKAVPERIRRRALRTLWKSNPVLANVDHLVEYGEDYTDSATVVENMQTAYQVGKGMLKHVEEMARQAAEAETPQDKAPTDDVTEEDISDEAVVALAASDITPDDEPTFEDNDEAYLAETAPQPRRMKFRIEETA